MSPRTLFPEFTVTAGTVRIDSTGRGDLFRLLVARDVSGGADLARIELGRSAELAIPEGESLTVELGYEGELTPVFRGTVTEITSGSSRSTVLALGAQDLLMRTRVDKSFKTQSAGEIFTALAGEAGAPVERAENGVTLSFYLADSSVHCYEHALRLGFHAGCDLYATAAGRMVFAPLPEPATPRRLRFGTDLIRTALAREPAMSMPRYLPESPAGTGGEETWISRDNSGAPGEAGEGTPRIHYRPLMRTQEHAQIAADTHWLRQRRHRNRGSIELVGAPDLELGDAVTVEGLPGREEATFQVLGIEHRFDFRSGFLTRARLGETEEGA
jgi:phage protein D